ncbi:FAD-dependent oxidoreductase [Amycolatopsis rubida]|uniref:FAD-dependent oxidoreductase n=1 Tax=Amycolatopsis rubida TaxID=112413 RepID=A0ABX0C2D5_9PSEU|nr:MULTISPECIES: FAD-dependent oxidoreductase [Amycolatopsis]MYW96509.1 NAD(P)-binding protein [Amycolatopsis rubida]NEC61494.1 FAD-dependent oxidoreductase [Amycolatopsis rubida]OAP25873.1 Pentachlorophenol 4-monooxygenase [Amycolatopsis sp. M39]
MPNANLSAPELPVLIVGAGPTGLTLACELARRGVAFRLVEASPGLRPGSRGKGLQPRSLEVFDDLGVIDRILANGRSAMPILLTGPEGQTSGSPTYEERPDVPYPASVITPQWRVEETLGLRLAELGGTVEFGTALESFDQSADAVTAVLRTGDQTETVRAEWLAGCDGGRGVVRKQAGIAFEGETDERIRMIVADLAVDGLDRDAWHMWRCAEGFVSLCPLPSTDLFQYQAPILGETGLDLATLQTIFDRRSGRADVRLHEPEWTSLWRSNTRLADRYRVGRVFLAGDAAHVHSPAGGQGMNTGIQDAHNLGWKLAAGVPELLDTYESERRPVAAGVLRLSTARLAEAAEQKSIPIRSDRDTTQLSVNYRGSALARDDRSESAQLRAGDRAPDAPGLTTATGNCRLFDLTRGGRFTLLNFGPRFDSPVRTFHVVPEPAADDEIADSAGHLARAYSPADRTLVLLRPDGYVGLISDAGDFSAVKEYLL